MNCTMMHGLTNIKFTHVVSRDVWHTAAGTPCTFYFDELRH